MFKSKITQILKELSVPVHLNGYRYLREAIEVMCNSSKPARLTKEIYPAVAKRYSVTHGSVERAIRHAIEKAWDRRDPEIYRNYFGVISTKSIPTNSEFIIVVFETLQNE